MVGWEMRGLWPASTAGKPSATKLRARVYTHLHAKDPECVYSVVLPLHYAARKAAPGPISLQEYTSHNSIFARKGDATRPHGHTSPHAPARSLAAASPSPDAVLTRLAAQRSNVLELLSGPKSSGFQDMQDFAPPQSRVLFPVQIGRYDPLFSDCWLRFNEL